MTPTEQRLDALQHANHVRTANSKLRSDLRARSMNDGMLYVADLLTDPQGAVRSMPVGRLLATIRRFGVVRAMQVCTYAGVVSMDRRVDQLTERQRDMAAGVLRAPELLWPYGKLARGARADVVLGDR